MKRLRWHLLPLLLFIFLSSLAVNTLVQAQQHDVQHQTPLADKESLLEPAQVDYGSPDPQVENEEDDIVQEAWSILRKIKPPTASKLARYTRKPKGVLGSAVYYAKQTFVLLFMNSPNPVSLFSTWTTSSTPRLSPSLTKAVDILQIAAKADNPDAIYLLAEMNFYGNFSHPISYERAFERYKQLADLDGNSTAQYMLGFMYATGLNPAVPADQAKSILYHTFAAEQGETRSEMTLAYRYHAGIATPRNCEEAVIWYKRVADKAVNYYRSGPPGGHVLVRDAYRLVDEEGGVYGEGASVSSAGQLAKQGGPTSDQYANIEDVMEYLHMQHLKGDDKSTFTMARMHYDGSRGLKRDLKLAKQLFFNIARKYWAPGGKVKKNVPNLTERLATKSAGYIGRMFLRGEGMEQSYAKAQIWFTRALANGDALSQYSLGLMYLHGLGVAPDIPKAATYLAAAADQNLAVAQTHLGILFLDQGDPQTATLYFELASRNSHIEAFWYLAELNNNAVGRDRSCGMAAVYYKIVAEKAEAIWSALRDANAAYEEGDTRRALVAYLMAAEQGSENAQANVAWLLDRTPPRWSLLPSSWALGSAWSAVQSSARAVVADAATALLYWTRSAKQNNIDSLVKMGDYYLLGLGTAVSAENAAVCYQAAAETQHSAQAMWNLGWMHENGLGIEQDFHLAKRFYDQALETNKEAYLPVKLSLWKLRWRSWWNSMTRGGVHGIEDDEEDKRKQRSFAQWLHEFLEADAAAYLEQLEADDWEAQREALPATDEYLLEGDFDDGILETLLICGLVAVLGGLIYYRQQQQRAAERRRQQGLDGQQDQQQQPAAPGQQPDGGFFPQPGDPNQNPWLAGGAVGL